MICRVCGIGPSVRSGAVICPCCGLPRPWHVSHVNESGWVTVVRVALGLALGLAGYAALGLVIGAIERIGA